MIPFLDGRGHLLPPASHAAAVERLRQLKYESAKIDKQLAAPTVMKDVKEALRWRSRASAKLNLFRVEEMQLVAWLAGWQASTDAWEDKHV